MSIRPALVRLRERAQKWKFFCLLALTYAYFFQGTDPNQHSRFFLMRAMVLRGALDITPDHGFTIDKSEHHQLFFCDKAPGLSFVGAPFYWVFHTLDRVAHLDSNAPWVANVQLHLLVVILCGTAGVVATYYVKQALALVGANETTQNLLTVGYALGTLAFPFSTVLFAHQPVAALLIASFVLILRMRSNEQPAASPTPSVRRTSILLGLFLAFAVISEYPAGLVGLPLTCLYLVSAKDHKGRLEMIGWMAVGASGPLLIHSLYLWKAFGSPTALPYKFVFEPFFRVHHDEGLLGINPPTLAGVFGVTISRYRGIFFLCPFLLLAFFGLWRWTRDGQFRAERRTVLTILIAYFVFNSSYYAWDGGGSTGPRHMIPVLPFYVVTAGFFFDGSALRRRIGIALVAVSIAIMSVSVAVLVHQPEGEVVISNPFYDRVLPALARHEVSTNVQPFMQLGERADASYNIGQLLGLSPLLSLVPLLALWSLSYRKKITSAIPSTS
jgi:hypothetical protein